MNATVKISARHSPPQPRGRFILGVLPELMADPLETLQEAARYGDVVGLPIVGQKIYLLSHPDHIRHVLVDNARNYRKGPALNATRRLTGNSVLVSEGELHTRQRRLAAPAFHRQRVAAYTGRMVEVAKRHIAAWKPGERRDIHRDMMTLTMEVVASCLYAADVNKEAELLAAALSAFIDDFSPIDITPLGGWLELLPTARQRRRRRNARALHEAIDRIVASGYAREEQREDLLSMLLKVSDDGHALMSEREMHDQVMTIFLAGQETTGPALSWTFYLLSQHPEEEARLHAELDRVLCGRQARPEDMENLSFTYMVFAEALRLYPPAWAIARRALAPDEIGAHTIPRGATVVMSQYVMHRHPAYWDAPAEFRPERFHPSTIASRRHYTYFPFGGGPRMCLGDRFAWTEGVLLIATIAQRFRLRLAPDARIEPIARMSIRLKHGLPMIVEER